MLSEDGYEHGLKLRRFHVLGEGADEEANGLLDVSHILCPRVEEEATIGTLQRSRERRVDLRGS